MLNGWLIVIVDVGRERMDGSGSRRRKVVGLGGWPVEVASPLASRGEFPRR